MQDRDKLKMFQVEVWKNSKRVTLFLLYNPSYNIPALKLVEQQIQQSTIIIGDFNSPSTRWGYSRTTNVGKHLDDFLDNHYLDVVNTPNTFLSLRGSQTRPDLAVTHPHITGKTSVTVLDDAVGCGHRALLVTCKLAKDKKAQNRAPRGKFKKADLKKDKECTNEVLTQLTLQ
uniref:Uncharacterized protein LOC114334660 n=1 Tax=Diabrotica virgifera virgifera TaxID=50390 RepID=A0A6P7G6R7_DIAVI